MACVGVRRTTGQHPGGVIVLPKGMDINWFTPVQHPANDMTTNIITTHFDYHSIDKNLLKLDILGHDDPTMIRMLQDLTGEDPMKVPLDDGGSVPLHGERRLWASARRISAAVNSEYWASRNSERISSWACCLTPGRLHFQN